MSREGLFTPWGWSPAISLGARHRRAGPAGEAPSALGVVLELPDLLGAPAGDGDLGGPFKGRFP